MASFKVKNSNIKPEQILPSLFRSNMLRMVLTKHIELNKMADHKANMLMTGASIMSAVILSQLDVLSNFDLIGLSILIFSAVLSVVFAILVVIPKPYNHHSKTCNLFYFRDFAHMTEEQYLEEILAVMNDKNAIYEHYVRDIYYYGSVTLSKKYRWLQWALGVFLVGILTGVLRLFYVVVMQGGFSS
jgi:disulfide bond formation protein DsbB